MAKISVSGALLLSLLCVAAVITAGCDYVPNRDIVVIRLHPDGTPAWTTVIDTGYDDAARDFIEDPGGGFVIAGVNTSRRMGEPGARLVRLSPGGSIEWDRVIPGAQGEPTAVIAVPGGGYAAVSFDGELWRIDADGDLLWKTSTGIGEVWTLASTGDSGYIVAGEKEGRIPFGSVAVYHEDGTISSRDPYPDEPARTPGCSETAIPIGPDKTVMVTQCTVPFELVRQAAVVKLDADGGISWMKSYGGQGLESAWSVVEAPDDSGYLVAGYGSVPDGDGNRSNYIATIRIGPDGSVLHTTILDTIEYFGVPRLRSDPAGFDMLSINTTIRDGSIINTPVDVRLDIQGALVEKQLIDTGIMITWTEDGGYFSAGFPLAGEHSTSVSWKAGSNRLHAVKIGPGGNQEWDREIPGVQVTNVHRVIQTADGGYAILAIRENY